MPESLGSAVLDLTTDQSGLEQGLGRAENTTRSRMGRIGGLVAKGTMAAAAGFAAAGGAAVAAAFKTADYGDEIAKTAPKLGVTTDALQELNFWAERNGISSQSLERAVGRLNQRVGRAIEGNENYAEAFKAVGVELVDQQGNVRSTDAVMRDTIGALRGIEDPALRSARASEIFGTKMARDLQPALLDGSLSLEDAAARANELGAVLGEDSLRAAERFQDGWLGVRESMMGALRRAAVPFMTFLADRVFPFLTDTAIPILRRVADWLGARLETAADRASTFFTETVVPAFAAAADVAREVVDWLGRMLDRFRDGEGGAGGLAGSLALLTGGPLMVLARELLPALAPLLVAVLEPLAEIAADVLPPLLELFAEIADAVLPTLVPLVEGLADALERHPGVVKAVAAAVGGVLVVRWAALGVAATRAAAKNAAAFGSMKAAAIKGAAAQAAHVGAMVAKWVFLGVQSLLHAAKVAAAWLIAMGPIGLVIAAVVGLVALIAANWDKIWSFTKKVWSAIVGAVSGAIEKVVRFFRELPGKLLRGLRDLAGRVLRFVIENHPAAVIWRHARELLPRLAGWFRDLPGNIISWLIGLAGRVMQWIIDHHPVLILWRKAAEFAPRLASWLSELPGKIVGWLGDLGRLLVDAGKDLVRGFWEGIKSMGGWLKDKVTGFLKGAVDNPVTDFLGISSPSQLFAGFGRDTAEGFVAGLERQADRVERAATRALAAPTAAVGGDLAGAVDVPDVSLTGAGRTVLMLDGRRIGEARSVQHGLRSSTTVRERNSGLV